MMMDGNVIIYRNNVDVYFYIVGSADENELMLGAILNTFFDTLNIILKLFANFTVLEMLILW